MFRYTDLHLFKFLGCRRDATGWWRSRGGFGRHDGDDVDEVIFEWGFIG